MYTNTYALHAHIQRKDAFPNRSGVKICVTVRIESIICNKTELYRNLVTSNEEVLNLVFDFLIESYVTEISSQ